MTIAATLATAPLIAFHFGDALDHDPASPTCWRCRRWRRRCGWGCSPPPPARSPASRSRRSTRVDALLLAYIAQVAAWCGRPSWAYLHVRLGAAGLLASYVGAGRRRRSAPLGSRGAGGSRCAGAAGSRRRADSRSRAHRPVGRRGGAAACSAGLARRRRARLAAGAGGGADAAGRRRACGSRCSTSARATRSCCSRPARRRSWSTAGRRATASPRSCAPPGSSGSAPRSSPTTSPTTPAGSRSCSGACRSAGSSTRGSAARLLGEARGRRRVPGAARRGRRAALRARCASKSSGRRASCSPSPLGGADPNLLALVMLARWRDFSMLLTADAEAEAVPIDPGPVDVLKVAHHGSDDAGLGALLDRTAPRLAVISVGAGNPYGHPTAATLATLAAHGVRTLRTDRDGTVVLDVGRRLGRGRHRAAERRLNESSESNIGVSRPRRLARTDASGRWLVQVLSRLGQPLLAARFQPEPGRRQPAGTAAEHVVRPARRDRGGRPRAGRVRLPTRAGPVSSTARFPACPPSGGRRVHGAIAAGAGSRGRHPVRRRSRRGVGRSPLDGLAAAPRPAAGPDPAARGSRPAACRSPVAARGHGAAGRAGGARPRRRRRRRPSRPPHQPPRSPQLRRPLAASQPTPAESPPAGSPGDHGQGPSAMAKANGHGDAKPGLRDRGVEGRPLRRGATAPTATAEADRRPPERRRRANPRALPKLPARRRSADHGHGVAGTTASNRGRSGRR